MLSYLKLQTDSYLQLQDESGFLELQESQAPLGPQFQKGESTVDAKYRALLALGYDGPLNEMESEWLLANGAGSVRPLPEMWSEMLESKGYGYPYSLNKAWELVLIDEGYSGTLSEMARQFWIDGGTFA